MLNGGKLFNSYFVQRAWAPSVNCQGRTDKAQLLIVNEFKGPGPDEFCPRSKGNGGGEGFH